MTFQENLRHYRGKAGYTAKEFAAKLGLKYSTYAAYENQGSEPKYDMLCKIADTLNTSTDDLLGREDGDSYEYCKNLIKSFEYEYMDVEEKSNEIICVSDSCGETCQFQSKKDFVDHVLAWEKSFLLDKNYKIYFNLNMYHSMTQLSEEQQRHENLLQYIKDSLDEITKDAHTDTKKRLQEILTTALDTIKTQDAEKSTAHE